jgi:hypothetical protein
MAWIEPRKIDVMAMLPEMRLLLNTIESPDTTVSPALQKEILSPGAEPCDRKPRFHKYAPMTNDMEPP